MEIITQNQNKLKIEWSPFSCCGDCPMDCYSCERPSLKRYLIKGYKFNPLIPDFLNVHISFKKEDTLLCINVWSMLKTLEKDDDIIINSFGTYKDQLSTDKHTGLVNPEKSSLVISCHSQTEFYNYLMNEGILKEIYPRTE